MPTASSTQVAVWVIGAGFGPLDRHIAVAVGLATGSNPAAPNGVFGVPTGGATSGAEQAKAAKSYLDANGWDGFPAYHSGRYLLYVPSAEAGLTVAASVSATQQVGGAVSGAIKDTPAGTAIDAVTLPQRVLAYATTEGFWVRAAKYVIGATLLVVAAASLAKTTAADPAWRLITHADRRVQDQMVLVAASSTMSSGGGGSPAPRPPKARKEKTAPAPAPAAERPKKRMPTKIYDGAHRGYGMGRSQAYGARHAAPALTVEK